MKYRSSDGQWKEIPAFKGDNGATFTPHVATNGDLSWTNDKGLPNPPTINLINSIINFIYIDKIVDESGDMTFVLKRRTN